MTGIAASTLAVSIKILAAVEFQIATFVILAWAKTNKPKAPQEEKTIPLFLGGMEVLLVFCTLWTGYATKKCQSCHGLGILFAELAGRVGSQS